MAEPQTPEQWLPILTARLDASRPRIDVLRSYTNGNAPLPEAGKNIRASWTAFQQKARTNFGALVVDALAERLICNGIMVGDSPSDDDRARKIWRDNRMDVALSDTIRDMLTVGVGYMVVGKDASTGKPVISSEQPEFMYAATDPLRSWVARAGVKVWRDIDVESDFAYVWANGIRQKFARSVYQNPSSNTKTKKLWPNTSGGWELVDGSDETYTGAPPIVVFENHNGMGEFEAHTDIIDRINKGLLDRLVTVAYQAFRQRAFKGGLPAVGEDGKPIDYAAVFAPAPGALWDLPEGIDIWESQESSQSIMAMLAAVKDDIRDLGAVTRTPLPMLAPDGQNQSATGSENAKEGLVLKAKDRISRIGSPLNELLTIALRVESSDFDQTVLSGWADPTHVTTAERYDAAVKAKAAGVPFRTIMVDILGFSNDKVDLMEVQNAEAELIVSAVATPEPKVPAGAVA